MNIPTLLDTVGQQVDMRLDPNRKHGEDFFKGPHTVTKVNDNGTVKLTKATNNGAVSQTWNIRNIEPRKDWSPLLENAASQKSTALNSTSRVLTELN